MSDFPNWSQRQQLLYEGKGSREERLRIARGLIASDRPTEAMDYLEVESDPELLVMVIDRARERGDAFLFRRASVAAGKTPSAEDWEQVAKQAESHGKESYARMAREAARGPADS